MIEGAGNGIWCELSDRRSGEWNVMRHGGSICVRHTCICDTCPERSTFLTTWTGSGTRVNVAHLVTECLERGFESRREFVQVVAET